MYGCISATVLKCNDGSAPRYASTTLQSRASTVTNVVSRVSAEFKTWVGGRAVNCSLDVNDVLARAPHRGVAQLRS